MADYCRILRTQGSAGVIPVQVLRGQTDALEGQLNGTPLTFIRTVPVASTATCVDLCVRSPEVGNGVCSDGGAGGPLLCDLGTDCTDCGPR